MKKKDEYQEYIDKVQNSEKLDDNTKLKYIEQIKILKKNKHIVILNSFHLANLIGIKWKEFKKMIKNPDKYYHKFNISKKSGGQREICAPYSSMDLCQRFIKTQILDKINISDKAHGFATDKSIITNARMHLNNEMILNIDLKDFFPSISRKKVFYVFNKICGYDSSVSHCLTKIVMYNGGLPQGACTSPILSNIVTYKMDLRLSKLAEKMNINYTRYADDITFSGDLDKIDRKLLFIVSKIIVSCGYKLNDKKTRFQSKSTRQEVTGLIVNNEQITVNKNYVRELRQELYYIKKYGVIEHKKRKNIYNKFYEDHIKGKIMFIYSIDKTKGNKFLKEYNEIFKRYSDCLFKKAKNSMMEKVINDNHNN